MKFTLILTEHSWLSLFKLSMTFLNVNILGGIAHTLKENREALIVASKEIGLEVNADKTKYMVMSQDQNEYENW